nr:MAG: hypothetical protein DIU68_13775 [Chloroflexota bacterium]
MAARKYLTSHQPSARKLCGTGLRLIGVGLSLLPEAHAQTLGSDDAPPEVTRYTSIFDSAVTAQPQAQATGNTPAGAPTRYTSIFDAQPAATSPETVTEAPGEAMPEESPTPAPQVTRYTSIFDGAQTGGQQPAQAATAVPQATRYTSIFDSPTQAQPAGQPTRVPSIFDSPTSGQPAGQPTRVPSIFDSAPGAQPAATTTIAPAAPIGSIFDSRPADVIRFEGQEPPDREYCLSCHANPNLVMELPSGEVISVTVNEEEYLSSVHGQHGKDGYRCIRCHTGMNEYPHPEVEAQSARELTIELSTSCQGCHADKYDEMVDDVHVALLASGNENAAVCSDCHTGHAVQRLTDETTGQPLPDIGDESAAMCATCHSEIYANYAQSVHGSAVLEGNPDAPTCADCHGVHNTQGPSTGAFRLFSPQICATCHADEQLMAKYGISTDVFDTYVADFHGTTVSIFQRTAPDQPINAPVCADCHGVHNIMATSGEGSIAIKENLVATCQRCHPGATTNFPDAWMSHYAPSLERTPLVAIATAAYTIGIPAIIGGLGLFVLSDIRRRRVERRKERQHED